MQLHQLKSKYKNKNKKRVGRGGKRGTYSGRGTKGQKAHAGRKIKSQAMVLIQRLPKLRGFRNKPISQKAIVLNVKDLNRIENGAINRDVLIRSGLIRKSDKRIKILGAGDAGRAFQIEGLEVSQSAKQKIEAAGGKIK